MKERRQLSSRLLTMKEAAVYLKIPLNTLYKMVGLRKIPFVKLNRLVHFDKDLLDQWIKERTQMPIY